MTDCIEKTRTQKVFVWPSVSFPLLTKVTVLLVREHFIPNETFALPISQWYERKHHFINQLVTFCIFSTSANFVRHSMPSWTDIFSKLFRTSLPVGISTIHSLQIDVLATKSMLCTIY